MGNRILVVDDDLDALKLIGLMLQGRGYEIIAAQSGPQALAKAAEETPDLVILDIMMPGMDGLEVCRQLRARPATTSLPVIMFTAKTQVGDKVAGFEAGADEYLTKPIHPEELVTRVEALIARSARLKTQAKPVMRAKLIGFLGCKGGVGTSTLAANVAVALARGQASKEQVFLLGFASGAASLPLQLGMQPQQGLEALAERSPQALDAESILSRMDRHTSGVMLLGGPAQAFGSSPSLDPQQAEAVLRRLGEVGDYILVDLGSNLEAMNQRLLRLTNYTFIVTEPQQVAVRLTQSLLDRLDELEIGRHRIGVVLMHKAPSATSLTKEALEKQLQREIVGVVSPAPELAFQAADQGTPMVMMQTDSLPVQQFSQLAGFVVAL